MNKLLPFLLVTLMAGTSCLCVASRIKSRAFNVNIPWCLGDSQGPESAGSFLEASQQTEIRTPGTFNKLAVVVSANTLASVATTIRSRLNTTNGGMSISVGNGVTGEGVDASGSDAVVSTDLYCFNQVIPADSSGAMTMTLLNVTFTPTSGTNKKFMQEGLTIVAGAGAVTKYPCLTGTSDSVAESDAQLKSEIAGSLSNLWGVISGNNLTTGSITVGTRIGGVTGAIGASIGFGVTGTLRDIANNDAVLPTNLLNSFMTTPAGNSGKTFGIAAYGYDFTTINYSWYLVNQTTLAPTTVTAGATAYWPVGGDFSVSKTSTESDVKMTSRLAFTASSLGCNVSANGITVGASTFRLRVNGSDSILSLSVPAGITGTGSEDLADQVSILSTDQINYAGTAGGTGTSITAQGVYMVGTILPIPFNPWQPMAPLLVM